MSRRLALGWALVITLAGTGGCSGDAGSKGESGTSSQATTDPSQSATAATTPAPAPAPPPPVTAEEPCPYLTQAYIEVTVGQRVPRVETVTVEGQPAPDCTFFRNDNTVSVVVDLTVYPDPVDAQNAALSLITPAATPITDIGEYGGVLVTDQTQLAVTRGALLVYLTLNQPSSLQAREIAKTVLAAIPPG